jgi:SAM-dependent methyltransferase
LEVGCGEGVIADKLARRFGEVVALDLPDAGLRADWRHYDGPRFLHASAPALPFADDQFDVVVAAEVLEHLPDAHQELGRWPGWAAATWSCRSPTNPSSATGPEQALSASPPKSPRSER